MNKNELKARIAMITNEMQKVKDHFSKLEGHLTESQHWLMEIEKTEQSVQESIENSKEQENGDIDKQSEEQAA